MSKKILDNREKILDIATHLFWKKGYNNTSMQEIINLTGMSRYSFYENFASKHALFLESMDYYLEIYVKPHFKTCYTATLTLAELETVLIKSISFLENEEGCKGCFLCNTDPSLTKDDEAMSETLNRHQQYVISSFETAIKTLQSNRTIRTDLPSNEMANLLYVLIKGILTSGNTNTSPETLTSAVKSTFTTLQPQ